MLAVMVKPAKPSDTSQPEGAAPAPQQPEAQPLTREQFIAKQHALGFVPMDRDGKPIRLTSLKSERR